LYRSHWAPRHCGHTGLHGTAVTLGSTALRSHWAPGTAVMPQLTTFKLILLLLLLQDHTLALLKAIGISEGGRGGSRRGGGRLGRRASREAHFSDDGSLSGSTPEAADPPGSLGAKLQELGRRLLQVRFCHTTMGGPSRGAEERMGRVASSVHCGVTCVVRMVHMLLHMFGLIQLQLTEDGRS
jgi:hypothetical protein